MSGIPQPKSNEFAQRYNDIDLFQEDSRFQLRLLAKDAQRDFEITGNPLSGQIAATCKFDLGKTKEGLAFFRKHISLLSESDLNDSYVVGVYLQYARMLFFVEDYKTAIHFLDSCFPRIQSLNLGNIRLAMLIYSAVGKHDKALYIKDEVEKIHPEWREYLLTPPLLEMFVQNNNKAGAIEYFLQLTQIKSIHDTNTQQINERWSILCSSLTHPHKIRDLTKKELHYLNKVKEWVLEAKICTKRDVSIEEQKHDFISLEEGMAAFNLISQRHKKTLDDLAHV